MDPIIITAKEFHWLDRSQVQFTHWSPGSPDGEEDGHNCVLMSMAEYPGFWDDHSCSAFRGYVCKMPKGNQYFTFSAFLCIFLVHRVISCRTYRF